MKLAKFTVEENQHIRELESEFNKYTKKQNLKYDYMTILVVTGLISLMFKIQTSLDINMSLMLLVVASSMVSTFIITYNLLADKLKLIRGDNFLIRLLSNFNILNSLVYLSAISSGIITGALIKNIYVNSFRIVDLLYVIFTIGISLLSIYAYKLLIPISIFLQDRFTK